ncbi:MAG: nucleocapsid protein [Bactrocera tryoni orthomyxo-like virus]|nr:MAG: nucleocapsid protein [Bactrocera tryoni orthomyxo-like virus]
MAEANVMDTSEIEYDPSRRNTELLNIQAVTFRLIQIYEEIKPDDELLNKTINLDRSNAYAGILSTLYMYWRKQNNTNVVSRGNDHATDKCTYNNKTFTVKELSDKISGMGNAIKWDFTLATPLVDVLTSFKLLWDECRLSASRFRMKNANGINSEKGITSFGLTNIHLPLLTGLTYKPERRAGMLRTLGPLTLAIALSAERKMHDKLIKAFKESIKMLPMADSIAECLRDAKGPEECRSLFCSLGDLLLCLGSRSTNKIHFPLLFFVKTFSTVDCVVDFSGAKGMLFYNSRCNGFTWEKTADVGTIPLAQVVFHSMFGTATEDLGILSSITDNREWERRSTLNGVFTKKSNVVQKFSPIKFRYISKLASASMTKGGATAQPMLVNKMVFSGSRKRNFSGQFLNYLESGTRQITYGRDVPSLSAALVRYKDSITQKIRNGTFSIAGTTQWVNADTFEEQSGFLEESGVYFYA